MKVAYPVIFTDTKSNILIEVPDLNILTESNEEGEQKGTIADAIMMARDAIGVYCIEMEDDETEIASASDILDIDIADGAFYGEGTVTLSLVDVDLVSYRRMIDNRTVRRNVTLPNWLNMEAEKAHLNVSKVLQEALMAKLKVRPR